MSVPMCPECLKYTLDHTERYYWRCDNTCKIYSKIMEDNKMSDYNKMPDNAIEVTDNYNAMNSFFNMQIEENEFRQVMYDDNPLSGVFDMRISWINKSIGLGYGIARDWKDKKIRLYKFGSEDNWNNHLKAIAKEMY